MKIDRNPEAAAEQHYDLIIIGGGIYGVMLTFEAVRSGLKPLLVEKDDFGSNTSFNSLRIIHGGLRDLQSLNIRRFLKFGNERQWYLSQFPEFAQQLPVLMPLYQKGLKRTQTFHIAFLLDRILTLFTGKAKSRCVPYGEVLPAEKVKQKFPLANDHGLKGGALWYDAAVPDSQRFIIELLSRANKSDAATLNYMQAVDLQLNDNTVTGIVAEDRLTGTTLEFHSNRVLNAAGPWNRDVVTRVGSGNADLYPLSLMWNVLFDREALSEYALGVSAGGDNGQIFFLHPWKGRLLIGTGHSPRNSLDDNTQPTESEIDEFIQGLNQAITGLNISKSEILHVYSGFVNVKKRESLDLTKEDSLTDHSQENGPVGLFTLQGTKFTAARATAEMVIDQIFAEESVKNDRLLTTSESSPRWNYTYHWYPESSDTNWQDELRKIIQNESVIHLDDLILRRTNLGDNPEMALKLAPTVADLFDWDAQRKTQEIQRIRDHFHWSNASIAHS